MKATGVVRKIDKLGRIVIPKEIREVFDLPDDSPVEIFTDGDHIVLKKYAPACIFCGEVDDITNYKSKLVCKRCIGELSQL